MRFGLRDRNLQFLLCFASELRNLPLFPCALQVDWSSYGPKLAQVALTFGADDVDAVPAEGPDERGWRRSPGEEIRRNITAAGFTPMPRDGCFEAVKS